MNNFSKEKAEKEIVDCMISGLESGSIKEEDLTDVSRYVLEKIDLLKNSQDFSEFLKDLSSKWPVFTNIAKIAEGNLKLDEENEVAGGVLTLLEHGKINEALKLAKTQTQ